MAKFSHFLRRGLFAAGLLVLSVMSSRAQTSTVPSLAPNPTLETDADGDHWPDGWPRLKEGGSWETEGANHFIRLKSTQPGSLIMLYREIPIPSGTQALELTWRQRVTGLKRGPQSWFDARIMMEFLDTGRVKVSPAPNPAATGKDTAGWVTRTSSFPVPNGAHYLKFMAALFNVEAGTFDLDDIVLKATDPASIPAQQKARETIAAKSRIPAEQDNKANWPPALRARGNRLVTIDSGKEVWLQGVNVPSLEWSLAGEQVHQSIVTGLDEWKGNVIRLPMKHDAWFGRKGQTDGGAAYRAVIDQCVTLTANRGAYLVLDLHTYRAPKDEYLEFWTDAATRYKNHPAVIFDLMNEPHGISWEVWRNGGFVSEKNDRGEAAFLTPEERARDGGFQSPGMQKMLDAVRATGAKNMVLAGGLDYAYRLDGIVDGFGLDDKSGHGIIYACHVYPWKNQWQKMLLNAAAKYPVLLGEVGADAGKVTFIPLDQQEDWETWVPAILGLIQQHKLNWTAWCFHPGASPRLLLDWDYTPTPFWGQQAKDALGGKPFPPPTRLR